MVKESTFICRAPVKENVQLILKKTQTPCWIFIHAVTSVLYESLQPYGWYPVRLLCAWDSPGKNTGVGCHSLLQGISHPGTEHTSLLSLAMTDGFIPLVPPYSEIKFFFIKFSNYTLYVSFCTSLPQPDRT